MGKSLVLLTTLFSGYNYGSSLQTFATKTIIEELGYACKLVARKSIIKGREIRIGKLLSILLRTLLYNDTKTLKAYGASYNKALIGDSALRFSQFEKKYLCPHRYSWVKLKKESNKSIACIAGSDQLWDPTSLYVDPLYYLRFAIPEKRISFSTSFGHDFIAYYNRKKIKKWLSEFRCISVREDSGLTLIKELCNRNAIQIIDPSLLLDGSTWRKKFNIKDEKKNYILAYFLDVPSKNAQKIMENLKLTLKCDIIGIPYQHSGFTYANKFIPSGPLEFLNMIANAKIVITDSFHGTAFSINMHTPFYVFDRMYGSAHSQNNRIISLLKMFDLLDRYEPDNLNEFAFSLDNEKIEKKLNIERKKAREYLKSSIESYS